MFFICLSVRFLNNEEKGLKSKSEITLEIFSFRKSKEIQ